MNDDWRVTVTLDDEAKLPFLNRLAEAHTASSLRESFDPGVVVTHGHAHVYAYASSEATARETERLARRALAGTSATFALDRWHPIEQEWEPAEVPLPQTRADEAAEHAHQQETESRTAEVTGHAEWEVALESASHREAVETARDLEILDLPLVRRWRYVLVGTATEDEAEALAAQLRDQVAPATTISVRPSGGMMLEVLPPNPFLALGRIGTKKRGRSGA